MAGLLSTTFATSFLKPMNNFLKKYNLRTAKGPKRESGAGFVFLEIIIAISLISLVFITLLNVGFLSINLSASVRKTTQANSLIKEEFEAIRSYRDGTTWATFKAVSFGGTNYYYFNLVGNAWNRVSGTEATGIFTRRVIFDQVYRDGSGNIAPSGTLDDNTIKATVTVGWPGKTLSAVNYLTNWQKK